MYCFYNYVQTKIKSWNVFLAVNITDNIYLSILQECPRTPYVCAGFSTMVPIRSPAPPGMLWQPLNMMYNTFVAPIINKKVSKYFTQSVYWRERKADVKCLLPKGVFPQKAMHAMVNINIQFNVNCSCAKKRLKNAFIS